MLERSNDPPTSQPEVGDHRAWRVTIGTRFSRIVAVLAGLVVVALVVLPAVASRALIQDLIFVFTMLALAQIWNALAGWGGLITVGQQAFVGLGGYALFAGTVLAGLDPLLAIPLAGLFAGVVAAVIGPLLFRLEGPYFAIGSWVVAEVCRLLCAQLKPLGGGTGMSLPNTVTSDIFGLKFIGALFGIRPAAARDVLTYWLALTVAVAIIVAGYLFARSRLGLALSASRDSLAASRSIGIAVHRIRYGLWIVCGCATGLAGAIIYLQKARISPDAAFSVIDWTAYVIFVVVIGGVRNIEGPIIGVLLLWGLQYYLAQFGSLYLLILGLIAIAVMMFLPNGLWGAVSARTGIQAFPVRRNLSRRSTERPV
jgi:branched-chain amino acid transport system permease protein